MSNLSEFQTQAVFSVLPTIHCTIFEPTESAMELGYKRVVLPIEEGRAKWEEYKADGLEEYFYYYEEKFFSDTYTKVDGHRYGIGYKQGTGTLDIVTNGIVFIVGYDANNLLIGETPKYATYRYETIEQCLCHAKKEGYL